MASPTHRLTRVLGSDAVAFVLLGIETAYRGAIMSPAVPIEPYQHPLLDLLDVQVWSWAWLVSGVAALAVSLKPRSRPAMLVWTVLIALHVSFGVSLLLDTVTSPADYPALASVSYLVIPALACWGISRRQEVTPLK